MTTTSAPGKIILAGEHAVVYGRPAIAIPVWDRKAVVTIVAGADESGCHIVAPQISLDARLADLPDDNPLALIVRLALDAAGLSQVPDWRIHIHSTIPIAGGLGSGAAIGAAVVRAVIKRAGGDASPQLVSRLVFESERIYHGTPSGIDNTVIAYGTPIWFVKGESPSQFSVGAPLTLLIADSGISASTKEVVGAVRQEWQRDRARVEWLFDAIAAVVQRMRIVLERGGSEKLGALLTENQVLLRALQVSSDGLERLVEQAIAAGATGAKLSGAGRGGNIIASVTPDIMGDVRNALLAAGARSVIVTKLPVAQSTFDTPNDGAPT